MAYDNVILSLSFNQCTILNSNAWTTNLNRQIFSNLCGSGDNLKSMFNNPSDGTLFEFPNGFKCTYVYRSMGSGWLDFTFLYNNVSFATFSRENISGSFSDWFFGLAFGVDASTERGQILHVAYTNTANASTQMLVTTDNNRAIAYTAITGAIQPPYTWSSVPAISGKNGILSLSTLKSGSINNGNPVSDATLNAFEILIEASNVGKLVLDTDIDESQVVIRYNIPNNTYQYVKLVYKENYAPESISDGVAIDIQQTDTQLVLDDITTTGTYYFKIFTDNGNSNTVVLNYVGIIPIIIKIERVW